MGETPSTSRGSNCKHDFPLYHSPIITTNAEYRLFVERPVDYLVKIAKYDMRKAMANAVNWTEQDQHYWNAIIVQAQKEGDAIMPEWDRERNLEADLMRKCRGLDKRARDGVVRNNDYQEIETKKQLKRDLQNGRTYL